MSPRFLQFHTLTPYAGTLLNRDDAGFAKSLRFGGKTRTRISSQCLKRHWRTYKGPGALSEIELPDSIRSRRTFEEYVVQPLLKDDLDEAPVRAVTHAFMAQLLGESPKAKGKKDKDDDSAEQRAHTSQVTVLGRPEVEFVKEQVRRLAGGLDAKGEGLEKEAAKVVKASLDRDAKANLAAMTTPAGLSAALFGRMVTSDILSRADAAIHVAHAFTVHEQEQEDDYFAAIDDLVQEAGEHGSGHINTTELTSGLFYGYVVVDLPLLVSNLTGCDRREWESSERGVAADVLERFVHIMATVSPGAKLGSTAPYSCSHLLLAEATNHQPRTLANAFLRAVRPKDDILAEAYRALAAYVVSVDNMYPWQGARCYAGIGPLDALDMPAERKATIDEVKAWVRHQILEG